MSKRNSQKSPPRSDSQSLLGLPPAPTTKTETSSPSNGEPDPDLLRGYQFGNQQMYQGKTPLDYIADPVTKIRPGSTMKKEPNGYTTVEFQEGVRPWHIIPPVAIWNKGQWYDQLDKKLQDAVHVSAVDEREAFICSGEGTPGDYLLRVYIVPIDVAKHQEPKHPSQWTKKQKEEGDGKKVTGSLYG